MLDSPTDMRNRFVTLLLLLLFSGSLLAGAHPCQARQSPDAAPETAPACHGHKADPGAPVPSGDEDDSAGKHHCEHACHMVALVQIQTSAFDAEPQAEMVLPLIARSLPLFSLPIDHIPLA